MSRVESQPLLHSLPPLPSEALLPQLHCGDDCGTMLITNLIDFNYEVHVLVAIGEGIDAIFEDVSLVIECAESSLQILE